MKLRHLPGLVRDLIEVLPSRTRHEWETLDSIESEKPTVILISGFAATNRNLSVMRKRLVRDGFNVVILAMDWQALSDGVRGLYRMSQRLSQLVLELRKGKCKGKAKIYLVAHSAGGLVARYYVQLLGGFHYCDGLVTLATPHTGTWLAALGFLTHLILKARCLLQMTPISPFIRKLNEATMPEDFRFLSISSTDDYLCHGKATWLPPTLLQRNDAKAIELSGLSHGDFLLSKKSYRICMNYLAPNQAVVHSPTPLAVVTTEA